MSSELNSIKELYEIFVQFPFVCTDTRKIVPNCLFFCLKGEHFDGNQFVNEALEKGARCVITEKREGRKKIFPFNLLKGCPKGGVVNKDSYIIVVDDVLKTLQQLAHYHRTQLKIPIIGITGTNGKTTTKELIATVLSKKYKTAYTQGNLNNHIGVPLTLLSIKEDDEIAVIEMGANHPGEIAELCAIALPDYGIITNIGKAHLEGFGSVENIIETKTALYRAAKVLFINAEDKILSSYALTLLRSYGLNYYGKNTDVSGSIVAMNPCLVIKLFDREIETQLTGNYNLPNILAAASIGRFFNVSTDAICQAISEYSPQHQRSQIVKSESNTIIADYYNANPTSVLAALENFLQIEASHKWVILGDMLELGEKTLSEHQLIIDFCEQNKLKTCFIGENYYALKNGRSGFFRNIDEFNNHQKSSAKLINTLVLIKGSRGIHLENVII